jgi:tRNA-modifying protein YgfZ
MIQTLRDAQLAAGAIAAEPTSPITSFGNDQEAIAAGQSGVAVCDRSHWGKIQVSNADRLRFLHNQTTNAFELLKPGQGCDTVFVTSTARTLDLATAYVMEDAVLLLVSPNRAQSLIDWMDRYIFFADKVTLKNVTEAIAAFSLIGPTSHALIEKLGAASLIGQPYGTHSSALINGINTQISTQIDTQINTQIAVGSGLASPGYTVWVDAANAATLWQTLTSAGATPMGEQVWERLRVEQGRPVPDHELTEDFNPLEAGLWQTISLTKGCYIGQETIARLHTYRGVKQRLMGIKLSTAAEPGSVVMMDAEKVGQITSCTATEDGYFALAYVRTKALELGMNRVKIDAAEGELVNVPFVSHEYI